MAATNRIVCVIQRWCRVCSRDCMQTPDHIRPSIARWDVATADADQRPSFVRDEMVVETIVMRKIAECAVSYREPDEEIDRWKKKKRHSTFPFFRLPSTIATVRNNDSKTYLDLVWKKSTCENDSIGPLNALKGTDNVTHWQPQRERKKNWRLQSSFSLYLYMTRFRRIRKITLRIEKKK